MSRIAVIMPTYNEQQQYLSLAIDSILAQTVQDVEFVIVVDNPNHPSGSYLEETASNNKRVRLIRNETNIGLAPSLNKALDCIDAEYIARMDADDISSPKRLETQMTCLKNLNASLVGSRLSVIDVNGGYLYSASQIPLVPEKVARALRFNNCCPHPSWFGTADFFRLGYRNIPLSEDYDLLLRASLQGMRIGNVGQELVQYRMTPDSISRSNLYTQFRYQKYLSRCYSQGCVAEIEAATAFACKQNDTKRCEKYSEANTLLNQVLALLHDKRFAKAAIKATLLLTKSASYDEKMLRLALASLNCQ